MAFTDVWDNTQPPDTQTVSSGAGDIRSLKLDIQQRMAAISGLDAAKQNFEAGFAGVVYFATDTGKIYQWSGAAWVDITSDFLLTTKKIVIQGASQMTIPAGTVTDGKVLTLDFGYARVSGSSTFNVFLQQPAGTGIATVFSLIYTSATKVSGRVVIYFASGALASKYSSMGIANSGQISADASSFTEPNLSADMFLTFTDNVVQATAVIM